VAKSDAKPDVHERSTGILAFLLGGLVLSVVGLVVELVGAADYPLLFKILILIGWVLVGGIAATVFFQRPTHRSALRGDVAFLLMTTLATATPTTLVVLSQLINTPTDSTAAIANEPLFGVGVLGVFAFLGAATLATRIGILMALLLPAVAVWAIGVGFLGDRGYLSWPVLAGMLVGALLPAIAMGMIRLALNRSQLERQALERKVAAFGDELDRARSVHDAMFPRPLDGAVQFEYTYNPLLGIGGDFLHTHVHAKTGCVTLTLLDVSGHGLAAALTVNRLFGELERLCAEQPEDVSPELLMSGLNRYVHLVMAKHSLYATAACIQLNPETHTLLWSVAGHPPPLLRRRTGVVEDLPCTSLILGAVGPEEFDPAQQMTDVAIGDTVIVYTDGTFESRNGSGEFFGLDRLRKTLAFDTPPRKWSTFVAHAVEQFQGRHRGRSQMIEDDLLVASIGLAGRRRVVRVTPESQGDQDPQAQADAPEGAGAPSPTGDQDLR
jgi:serine phosphatase RsbU (regulator of sigma subunit)